MRRPGWRRPLFLTAGLLLLTAVPAAPAQEAGPSAAFLQGTEVFRRILFETGFAPLENFADLTDDPIHTLLIFLGNPHRLTEVPGGLKNYVDQGGALFLATDRKLDWEAAAALRQTAGVEVSGTSMVCDDKDSCYHGLPYCSFLRPTGEDPDLFRNLTPEGAPVSTVASNAPSYLERLPWAEPDGTPFPPPLATLPPKCYPEGGVPTPGTWHRPQLFAVGGGVGEGRVLVLADHSVFINEMMFPEDEGNVEFTYNCLEWLRGDDQDPRTRVLFVEEGVVKTRFEVPLKEVPNELMDKILDTVMRRLPEAADKATPALERELMHFDKRGGADDLLLRFLRWMNVSPVELLRILAVTLAVLVVLYGCWKVGWKARHRSDLQGPLLASALYRLAPAGSVPEQRRQALIHGDNLWEPARDLARQFLTEVGVPAGATPPHVEVQGGWLRRWKTTGRVKRLWRLAYGSPARVSLAEWRRLLRDVKQLKTAMEKGTVRIT